MLNFIKALEMRSVIALVAVSGSVGLALFNPNYGMAAVSVLSTAVGGYYGVTVPHENKKDNQ